MTDDDTNVIVIPYDADPDPCSTLACPGVAQPVEACEKAGCPFGWSRRGREDRAIREAKDRAEGGR